MHCRSIVLGTYYNMMMDIVKSVSEPLKVVLLQLVDLYASFLALKFSGDLLRVNFIAFPQRNFNDYNFFSSQT